MDYSSLTETHQQQQYQQPDAAAAATATAAASDPSQSYDAYYAYHAYHQQQQHYEYDPSAAAAAAYHQQQHYDYYSTQTHPQPDPPAAGPTAQIHESGPSSSYPVPPGMNPAAASAVAALSELSEYAGSMAEWQQQQQRFNPYHYPVGHQWHPAFRPGGGGGGRGAAPFRGGGGRRGRGGGRGNPSHHHHHPRPDGGAPPSFRGRGRGRGSTGRGSGRKPYQSATDPQPTHSPAAAFAGQPSNPSGDQQVAATPPVHPNQPVFPIGWCDICRVDCNSLDALENHRNGKRHKKTVQRVEEIQRLQNLLGNPQPNIIHGVQFPTAITESIPAQLNGANTANLNSESKQAMASTAEPNSQPEAQLEAENVVDPSSESGQVDRKHIGTKRTISTKFGRGGKRLKGFEPPRVKALAPKERPLVCTVCNVMCDTAAVFDSHLAGRKHLSKINQFQCRGSTFGPITVYIPPNQPSGYPTKGQDPVFFGLKRHEVIQQEAHTGLNGVRAENYGIQQGGAVAGAEGGVQESVAMKGLDHPDAVVAQTDNKDSEDAAGAAALDRQTKETSVSEANVLVTEAALHTAEDAAPLPEFGSAVIDDMAIPGVDDSGAAGC